MDWFLDKIISHRGASKYAPENTLVAFETAYALGSRSVEFDVMLSADEQAFIFHDQSVERTTNGKGDLGLLDSNIIQSLDAGSWFDKKFSNARVPKLEEVIDFLIKSDMNANIEIKPYPGFAEQTTLKTLEIIQAMWPANKPWPLISSFDLSAITLCKKLSPHLPIGLLLHEWCNDAVALAREFNCCSVHLNRYIATENRVQLLKQSGYHVCVYTVDDQSAAKKFISWGVDSIFSNDPKVLGSF